MKKDEYPLLQLIDDPAFIDSIKRNNGKKNYIEGTKWLQENEDKQILTEKAMKLISMPFLKTKIEQSEIESELLKLKRRIDDQTCIKDIRSVPLRIHKS